MEKRISLKEVKIRLEEGSVGNKMKHMIQSLKYKNSPKEMKLVKYKKALAEAYERLGLWNEWKDIATDAYEL